MASFQNPDGTSFNEAHGGPVFTTAPGTGSTITLAWNQYDLYVSNAASYTALTVKLPPGPSAGVVVSLAFQSAITTLTVHDGFGNAITGAPTAGAAHTALLMRYINSTIGWVYWK